MPSLPGKLYAPLDWLKTNVFLWPYLGAANIVGRPPPKLPRGAAGGLGAGAPQLTHEAFGPVDAFERFEDGTAVH